MESKLNKTRLPTKQNNFNNPEERARILRTYAGIFPNDIKEFGDIVIPRLKKKKNYSR